MRLNRRRNDIVRTSLLLLAFSCALMTGCQQAKSAAQSQAEHDDDHGHGRPAHKPYHLHGAVREVSHRGHELIHLKSPDPTATEELLDIIRWLPEFAADTDLTRLHWEEVRELSKRLEVWAAPAGKDDASFQAPDHTMLDRSLSELRKIAALVPQPTGKESELEHAHHHHHGHSHGHGHDHDDHEHDNRPAETSDTSTDPAK